jgi:hypothetical protein
VGKNWGHLRFSFSALSFYTCRNPFMPSVFTHHLVRKSENEETDNEDGSDADGKMMINANGKANKKSNLKKGFEDL